MLFSNLELAPEKCAEEVVNKNVQKELNFDVDSFIKCARKATSMVAKTNKLAGHDYPVFSWSTSNEFK